MATCAACTVLIDQGLNARISNFRSKNYSTRASNLGWLLFVLLVVLSQKLPHSDEEGGRVAMFFALC